MKRKRIAVLLTMLLVTMVGLAAPRAEACVGKMLHIGVINSSEGHVLAEMISFLINERTGSTVTIQFYDNEQDLYRAVTGKKVDIAIENTTRALRMLNRPAESDLNRTFEVVKSTYEKEKGMVWLKPFGFTHGSGESPSYTAPVLRIDVLNNFPALPRVIGKLGQALNDDVYAKLMKAVESGEQPKKAAKDFLKSKKLI